MMQSFPFPRGWKRSILTMELLVFVKVAPLRK